MTSVSSKAPGKLYLAGEYSVVTPGYFALLVAVERFVHCTVSDEEMVTQFPTLQITALNYGRVYSKGFTDHPMPWIRIENNMEFNFINQEKHMKIVQRTIQVAESYIFACGKSSKSFDLFIDSQLDDVDSGEKYGLGSSAAVSVAIVKALLDFYQVEQSPLLVYKLVSLAHFYLKSNGSFGDIAASSHGGWLKYACFDRKWLEQEITKKTSILDLINQDWPKLVVEPFHPHEDLDLFVAWTGKAASTEELVTDTSANFERDFVTYQTFLDKNQSLVERLQDEIELGTYPEIVKLFKGLQENLIQMTQHVQTTYLTKDLQNFLTILSELGIGGKISGAGGGDCAIALVNSNEDAANLQERLSQTPIKRLDIEVYHDSKGEF